MLKNYCGTVEIKWSARLGQPENIAQDAQKGRPARPQRAKKRRRTLRYVELLSEARTPLADFFSILLTFELSDLAHEERGLQPHEFASGLHASECPSRLASTRFRDEPS
jgi:hypothetical protein